MAVVVIPWRSGDPHREAALVWVVTRHNILSASEGYDVRVASYNARPWCKAKAIMPVIESLPADVVVVADADVWCDGIPSAVRAVTCGVAQWAVPHRKVHRLSKEATGTLYATGAPGEERDRDPYDARLGGGIVVAHRDTLTEVPLDHRFVNWGQEDESWGTALTTIFGPPWQGSSDLLHLWHPPEPRLSPRRGSKANWDLYIRYQAARWRGAVGMRELIAEIQGAQ